jgi:hypothetical protein
MARERRIHCALVWAWSLRSAAALVARLRGRAVLMLCYSVGQRIYASRIPPSAREKIGRSRRRQSSDGSHHTVHFLLPAVYFPLRKWKV